MLKGYRGHIVRDVFSKAPARFMAITNFLVSGDWNDPES
jgi:hypothetical protein